jgi:hypothetical protein
MGAASSAPTGSSFYALQKTKAFTICFALHHFFKEQPYQKLETRDLKLK